MTGSFMTLAMLLLANPAMAQQCMHVSGARIAFEIIQDGAPFSGEFAEGGGRVCMDGERIISIEAWLAPASVNTGLPELDAALQEAEFFDTRKFPRVAFTSKDIETAAQAYIAHGELQVKRSEERRVGKESTRRCAKKPSDNQQHKSMHKERCRRDRA